MRNLKNLLIVLTIFLANVACEQEEIIEPESATIAHEEAPTGDDSIGESLTGDEK